ncbi:PepSY domain-containing protein [Sphingosinicella sp. LHD-64]|uniref:PepSY domain-containing protein n=1 Tax=Sphingosinicella sp. LHD-64 TaxID=3072139 RepID=UPI00280F207A|nr:PepSY domain-containing protein [Sphingosinicella sp. LHD-64]MDQ8757391.1 PepSY domain-containing protein [Sphingosinicella sp. LHD-64]
MAKVRWPLVVRRFHKWLALIVGVQVVLWTVTGVYMVVVHIDTIHGDHLVRAPIAEPFDLAAVTPPARIAAAAPGASELRLQRLLDRPVWRVETPDGAALYDAASGARLAPLAERAIRTLARRIYAGRGDIVAVRLLTEAPLEMQSRAPPYWQVEFEGWNRPTLYLSPMTGELISRRHALWRVFDFAWMLHIMDYEDRTNVNNPLLRIATWSALAMALSGAWLLLWSFPRRKKKKKAAA